MGLFGSKSGPRGPSDAQIRQEARLEEERVRFENEKRQFIERVGAYETLASNRLQGERSSFEAADWVPPSTIGIQIPEKFSPSFDFAKEMQSGRFDAVGNTSEYWRWFDAPNLGIRAPSFENHGFVKGGNRFSSPFGLGMSRNNGTTIPGQPQPGVRRPNQQRGGKPVPPPITQTTRNNP